MLNQCILVGRLQADPVLVTQPDGETKSVIVLDIQRGFKASDSGEYEMDSVPITLWRGIAENTAEYCKEGSTVGVKARLSVENGIIEVVADKITFINTKKPE